MNLTANFDGHRFVDREAQTANMGFVLVGTKCGQKKCFI